MSKRIIIGLTGNIATGKSTVAQMLADLGATVVDADQVTHDLMAMGGSVHTAIVAAFGPQILGADGEIDRARLGAIVFADPAALAALEGIVHPAVIKEVTWRAATAPTPVVVAEAIKLIEAGMAEGCDSLWVTTCSTECQIDRMMGDRGLSREGAQMRVDAQPPQEEKLAHADVVIDTSTDLAETQAQVKAEWDELVGTVE